MVNFHINVNFPDPSEKLSLEIEVEQTLMNGGISQNNLFNNSLLFYIESRSLEEISSELIQLALKKLLFLIGNTKIDQELAIDLFFQEAFNDRKNALTRTLDKNRAAACRHLLNAARSTELAAGYSTIDPSNMAFKIILAGVLEIYEGNQSFYSPRQNSASEIATKGGLARAEKYRPTKEKACALLIAMEPKDGWASRSDALEMILPEIKRYLTDNNIRMPSIYSIETTLSDWLRNDSLVSNAVRLAN